MTETKGDVTHSQMPSSPPPPLPPPPPLQPRPSPNLPERSVQPWKAPVDHGWAWVVLFSSFFVSTVVDGVGFSVGILFSSLQKEFSANNQQVSWVSSVLNGTYLLIGPVVSYFVNKHGCRKVALLGCVMAAVSFALSTLACSIELVIFVYGLVGGIGLGLLYQPSVVIVGHYFHVRRALALGIMACGSGMGAFAFAPVFSIFVERYSWKGATYLAAALTLIGVFACATFKPLIISEKAVDISEISSRSLSETPLHGLDHSSGMSSVTEISAGKESPVDAEGERSDEPSGALVSILSREELCAEDGKAQQEEMEEQKVTEEKRVSCSNLHEKTFRAGNQALTCCAERPRKEKGIVTSDVLEETRTNVTSAEEKNTEATENGLNFGEKECHSPAVSARPDERQTGPPQQRFHTTNVDKNTSNVMKNNSETKTHQKELPGHPNVLPVVLDEKAMHEKTGNIAISFSETSKGSHPDSMSHMNGVSDVTVSVSSKLAESSCHRCFHRLVWLPVKENLRLMKRPSAIVYGIACFLMSVGMYVPTTFLPPMAEQLNFEASKGAFLVSAIGIGNVVGRLLTGLLAHYYPRLVMGLNLGSLIVAGVSTCFVPLIADFYLLVGYSLLFGACIGMFVVLQLMVLIDLLGFDHLTNAFGVVNVYHGVGTFVGPPLAGLIADTTGGLNSAFYAIGAAFTLAGLICLPLHRTSITEYRKVKASSGSIDLRTPNTFCSDHTERPRGKQ